MRGFARVTPHHGATTDTTDDAAAWIAARGAAPWFLWLGYNAPHTPFHKPPDGLHTYDTTVGNWATCSPA